MNKFQLETFNVSDLEDPFFDSLKSDYLEFSDWFKKKASKNEKAYLYQENGIKAFLYLKNEYNEKSESIKLDTGIIPAESRIKIGTLKLLETVQGMRLGEGAIGMALWYWQSQPVNEIYVTVFDKHEKLIKMLVQFGFSCRGRNQRGENVFFKDKRNIDISTSYSSFPYINGEFNSCGYIPIADNFHDTLFPYSELRNTEQESQEIAAANGITKVFLATPFNSIDYRKGDPVFIYRKYTGNVGKPGFKSVVTSFCTIVDMIEVKKNGRANYTLNDYLQKVGNKSVYENQELINIYNSNKNLYLLVMLYNGYLGSGNNITYMALKNAGYFTGYPYQVKLNKNQFENILKMGGKNVQNIIIN